MYVYRVRNKHVFILRAGCNVHATSGCLRKNAMSSAAYAGDAEVFELLSNQGGSCKFSLL